MVGDGVGVGSDGFVGEGIGDIVGIIVGETVGLIVADGLLSLFVCELFCVNPKTAIHINESTNALTPKVTLFIEKIPLVILPINLNPKIVFM